MKRTIMTLAIILFTSTAWAGPFLVCDPYPAEDAVTHFTMKVDGTLVTTPYAATAEHAVVLDLQGLDTKAHQITDIAACNARGCSDPPLAFAVPELPALPKLRLIP
jgi:hypothetical protein